MDESPADEGGGSARAHSRNHSRRQAVPRRATKDPLDTDDPLQVHEPSTSQTLASSEPAPPSSPPAPRPSDEQDDGHSPAAPPAVVETPKKNFSFLLKPSNYHSLDANLRETLPAAVLGRPRPDASTPLPTLLERGEYIAAAKSAADTLTSSKLSPEDHAQIFSLLHTRLVCLCLLSLDTLAAQESKFLEDTTSPYYYDSQTRRPLLPWGLRVLCVRLQALGYGDWRRGIMMYYELAGEARGALQSGTGDRELWMQRLEELGVCVANALLEIGDVDGAARHLRSLKPKDPLMLLQAAMVLVKVGDITAARTLADELNGSGDGEDVNMVLQALLSMADGEYKAAAAGWNDLQTRASNNVAVQAVYRQNMALCLVYTGDIKGAQLALEGLVAATAHPELDRRVLFNLCTIHELRSERSGQSKKAAVEKLVTERIAADDGFEWTNADFKL